MQRDREVKSVRERERAEIERGRGIQKERERTRDTEDVLVSPMVSVFSSTHLKLGRISEERLSSCVSYRIMGTHLTKAPDNLIIHYVMEKGVVKS